MKIRYDFEYLIHLIYCAINNIQPEEKPEEISFSDVFELGKAHEVANIAFLSVDKLLNKPDGELYNDWQVFYYHSVQRCARQQVEYNNLTKLLTDNKIRWTEAQGTITKNYYPFPEWRMMSDIDFIVDVENLDKIRSLFENTNCTFSEHDNELNVYPEKGTGLEFHTEFFTEFYKGSFERYSGAINHPFEKSSPSPENEYRYVLDDTHYYLYSLLHTIKHFEYAGCGIRRIVDLHFLNRAFPEIAKSEYINGILEKYGFTELADKLFQLEDYWFYGKTPTVDLSETIYDIIVSGNHGIGDIKLRNSLRREAEEEGGLAAAKRRKAISFLFPSLENMYEGHPEFREKGYSLFKCHIVRAAQNLHPKKVFGMFKYFLRINKSK